MTDDLMAFLRARLDEDEVAAHTAAAGPWHADGDTVYADHPTDPIVDYVYHYSAEHIARHDPARVLRDVEAKRLLLDAYDITRNSRDNVKRRVEEAGDEPSPGHVEILNSSEAQVGALDDAIRYTATVYADHLDYREEWRP